MDKTTLTLHIHAATLEGLAEAIEERLGRVVLTHDGESGMIISVHQLTQPTYGEDEWHVLAVYNVIRGH